MHFGCGEESVTGVVVEGEVDAAAEIGAEG